MKLRVGLTGLLYGVAISAPCAQCGSVVGAKHELHHVDPTAKRFDPVKPPPLVGLSAFLDEMEKCVVLCTNCHNRLHSSHQLASVSPGVNIDWELIGLYLDSKPDSQIIADLLRLTGQHAERVLAATPWESRRERLLKRGVLTVKTPVA